MKTKIQIKSVLGKLLFEYETDNNSIKKTLEEAVKNRTNLWGANLWGADLLGANLRGANLWRAYLRGAYLRGADLRGAYLRGAYLRGANLWGANLWGADLLGANLRGANLCGADLDKIISQTRIVPEEGAFIGWKNVGGCIVKLEIPSEAKRHNSITGRKCRAEFVKVLEIRNKKGHHMKEAATEAHRPKTVYRIGEIVRPDSYDPDPLVECSNGIHFFISRQEAKDW